MPKAEMNIELDNPKDYFEILEGDKFKHSKVDIKANGRFLTVRISAENSKGLISALGSMIKQVRIIDQTSELLKK